MRVDQLEKTEYRDILLYKIEENGHGDYPFFIQKVTVDHEEGSLHRHDYFQIYYVAKGRLKHYINGKTFGLTKGDLFVIPPYIPHKTFSFDNDNERCEALEIEFKPEFINQSFANDADLELFMDFMYIEPFMVNEHQVRPRLRLSGSVEMDVEKIVYDFLHEFEERKPGFELIIKSAILRLLAILGREAASDYGPADSYSHQDKHKESILRIIQYIEEHYTEKIYLHDIVKRSFMCHSYFCSAFKQVTKKSFARYLNELRVSRAKEFLCKTDLKIVEICSKTGFNNVTHFNRIFKQITTMSPMQFKETYTHKTPKSKIV
ncbi:AraC family transcriptional regulator [Paenibacillus contaminans]|uniref:HTH araC/xylS-type domain-containing protein n=1 Tax=Paenibacillus contaminans TaxID=450362 RepID=A0A329MNS5_9BACL|nr:AraC family transcriptional regulator [Paenibacillus contaminans]RAV21272.1 hypothetical protein DQG23_11480 [Paenibacillus contaminans]